MGDSDRHGLLVLGFPDGYEFCTKLLECADFRQDTLRKFTNRENKSDMAYTLATQVVEETVSAERVLLEFCRQSRQWLSLSCWQCRSSPPAATAAKEFFLRCGDPTWFGPIGDGATTWYVRTLIAPHFIVTGETAQAFPLRWHVVAELAPDHVALHWNNFTHTDKDGDDLRNVQFPYWKHVPSLFTELASLTNTGLDEGKPSLHRLLLFDLWDMQHANGVTWQHQKIRAEQSRVALNASSVAAATSEFDISGLDTLARALAKAATQALQIRDESAELEVARALLRTFLREWGTKSYGFAVEGLGQSVRAHCYFGMRPELGGPDSFQHLKCLGGSSGGSRAVLQFLREHLGLWQP